MAASVICPSCQLPNIPERRTCKRCGASLEGAAAVEGSVPPPVAVVPASAPVASTPPPTPRASAVQDGASPVPQSVKLSAYLCFAQTALLVVSLCLATYLLGSVFNEVVNNEAGAPRGRLGMAGFVAVATAVLYCVLPFSALLYALAGVGLLKHWGWARVLALGLSFITAVVAFPLGTLLAVPVIIQLFKPEAKAAFVGIPPSPAPPMPPQP